MDVLLLTTTDITATARTHNIPGQVNQIWKTRYLKSNDE